MAKIFQGNVSVWVTSTDKVVIKADPEGQYNQGNIDDLVKRMVEVGRKEKAVVNFFIPQPTDAKNTGLSPVMLTGRGYLPYIALLPERKDTGTGQSNRKQPRKIC